MYKHNDRIPTTFTTGQAAKATGVAYDQINYWAKTGFIVPSVQKAAGSSTCRVYNFGDLVALRVAGQLRQAGVALQGLRQVIAHLQQRNYDRRLDDAYLIVTANGEFAEKRGKTLISRLHRPGQMYFVLALGEAVEDLRTNASKLKPPSRGKACAVA